jgi:hypothetical protein
MTSISTFEALPESTGVTAMTGPQGGTVSDHTAMARLPDEILTRIFAIVRDDVIFEEGAQPVHWAAFLVVCRGWLNVALCSAHLWSTIRFTSCNVASSLADLARAGDAPLSIFIDRYALQDRTRAVTVVSRLAPRFNRVKELSLQDDVSTSLVILQLLSESTPAPALEMLTMQYGNLSSSDLGSVISAICRTPRLRVLDLNTFLGPSNWFRTMLPVIRSTMLTDLSLSSRFINDGRPYDRALDSEAFAGFFTQLHTVERLSLAFVLPVTPPPAGCVPARLERLVMLTLRDGPDRVAHAMQYLAVPDTTNLAIHLEDDFYVGENMSRSFEMLAAQLVPRFAHKGVDHVEITDDEILESESMLWRLRAWDADAHSNATLPAARWPRLTLTLKAEDAHAARQPAACLAPLLGAAARATICARRAAPVTSDMLAYLPGVRELRLSGPKIGLLVNMLAALECPAELLPHLQDVRVCDACLDTAGTRCLAAWLEARRKGERPFDILSFGSCGITHHLSPK